MKEKRRNGEGKGEGENTNVQSLDEELVACESFEAVVDVGVYVLAEDILSLKVRNLKCKCESLEEKLTRQ